MSTILVTGFQPFGGEKINPAWEAVRALPDTIAGANVVKLEIPVVFGSGADAVSAAIDHIDPDIVLCVGQAGGRAKITPEFVGINYRDARIPDNDGNQPHAEKIVEDGPVPFATEQATKQPANTASLPIEVMTRGLEVALAAAVEHEVDTVGESLGTTH